MTTLFSRALLLTLISVGIGGGYAQSPIDNYGISLPNYTGKDLPIPDVFPDDVPFPDFVPEYMKNTVGRLPDGGLSRRLSGANSRAGARLLERAAQALHPHENRQRYPKLAEMVDVVSAYLMNDDVQSAEELAAQVGGDGLGNLHAAWRSLMERRLRAFGRQLPCMPSVQFPEKDAEQNRPWSFWANVDMDRYHVDSREHTPGYRLRSYGGTVGAAMVASESLTLGLSVSGGHGRLRSVGGYTDMQGELDSLFVSAYALWQSGRWQHRLTGCVGVAELSFDRSVYMPTGYAVHGSTHGRGVGLFYELSRDFVIAAEPGDCMSWCPFANVSYLFTRLGGCTESGGDAALQLADSRSSNGIFGLGVRLRSVFTQSGFGSPFAVDIRVQGKAVAGPRRGEAEVSLPGVPGSVTTYGADPGAVGVEFGMGFNLPLRAGHGALFADGAAFWEPHGWAIGGVLGYLCPF